MSEETYTPGERVKIEPDGENVLWADFVRTGKEDLGGLGREVSFVYVKFDNGNESGFPASVVSKA